MREIFALYLELGSLIPLVEELDRRGWRMKEWTTRDGRMAGGRPIAKNNSVQPAHQHDLPGQGEVRRRGVRGRARADRRRRNLESGPDDAQPQRAARRTQYRQQAWGAAEEPRAVRHLRCRHDPYLRPEKDAGLSLLRMREGAPAGLGPVRNALRLGPGPGERRPATTSWHRRQPGDLAKCPPAD